MHLWNDYEGKIIADHYPLNKLVRPEGRSAFFLTAVDGTGPEVIRLTESLNDETEMLERWHQVTEVHQPNLVKIKTYGQTTFDGVPLTYALMESTDASLAEILTERPLTPAETTEVALAVAGALEALHASSLVHEHVEPSSVMASGEVIKLRSDCVRQCLPDGEFQTAEVCEELRKKDVRDLGVLLLRCLTLDTTLQPDMRLASPFNRVIPATIDGTFTLADLRKALAPPVAPFVPAAPVANKPLVPQLVLDEARSATVTPRAEVLHFPEARAEAPWTPPTRQQELPKSFVEHPLRWASVATILLLLVIFAMRSRSPQQAISKPVVAPAPSLTVPQGETPTALAKPSAALSTAKAAGWRVVAYTYHYVSQAQAKADQINRRHPRLNAAVFTPFANGPSYITLGNPTDQVEADSVVRQARRMGMPRDTFARFYGVR